MDIAGSLLPPRVKSDRIFVFTIDNNDQFKGLQMVKCFFWLEKYLLAKKFKN